MINVIFNFILINYIYKLSKKATTYRAPIIINVTNVNTATIFENEIQVTALNAYPNPVVDYLNVEFETELSEVEVSVMNGAGQTIFIDNAVRWNGSNKVVVPMSDQPNGLYIIKVGEVTRKVVRL